MFDNIEQLNDYLKEHVSEKRYIHSLGVAKTAEEVLRHYNKEIDFFNGMKAPEFCGLAHDLGRELSDLDILSYCKVNNIELSSEQKASPVLAHGIVSADIAEKLFGSYPFSWKRAICIHTTGDTDMDDLALALFVSDYFEPSRVFMTEERRRGYLKSDTLQGCALLVLKDMISHWKEKGYHDASEASVKMLSYLEGQL